MTNLNSGAYPIKYAVDHRRAESREYNSIPQRNAYFIIKTNLEGRVTYANPFFCDNFGLDHITFSNKYLIDQIIVEDHQVFKDTLRKCLIETGSLQCVTLRENCCEDIISTYWEFKSVQCDAGQPKEILCIGHDLNIILEQQKLKSLVDETLEQNKKLVNFTYAISHNIKSHIANIIGIIDLNETGTDQEREMSWHIIKKCMVGLGATINSLNEIINIQTHHHLPVKKQYLITELNRIISSVDMLFDKSDTAIKYHFDKSVYLETNPAYLESIILNLFTNAIKYKSTGRSLRIDVSLVSRADYQILSFRDNGKGINLAKHGEKIFGMYKTFHGNPDAKGMGLYIVKTQIEALGGRIEVESVVEQFTTFKVYFKQKS